MAATYNRSAAHDLELFVVRTGRALNEIHWAVESHGRVPEVIDELYHIQAQLISALASFCDGLEFGCANWSIIACLREYEQAAADLLSAEINPGPEVDTYYETARYVTLFAGARNAVAP